MRNISKSCLEFMSLLIISVLFVTTSSQPVDNINSDSLLLKTKVMNNVSSMPLTFTENQGQWDDKVLFNANAGGATMWFTKDGPTYQFTRSIHRDGEAIDNLSDPLNHLNDQVLDSIESIIIKASFVGANLNPQMVGAEIMEYKCNYFIGNDPNEWHTDVPNYKAIIYEDIYSGINLKYYGNGNQMEYDFIVSPGTDPSQIAVQYDGAESISINTDGELVVKTEWGEVIEQRPIIYQTQNGIRKTIKGEFNLTGNNSFGFSLGSSYDSTLPLVIDPVLAYSTYLGAFNIDVGHAVAVDGSGSAYITGRTYSSDFPTEGEYQIYQGNGDAFVAKLNNSGNGLVYSTYLGGSADELSRDIAVDGSGNVYITGQTYSTDFPTVGEYQIYQGNGDALLLVRLIQLIFQLWVNIKFIRVMVMPLSQN